MSRLKSRPAASSSRFLSRWCAPTKSGDTVGEPRDPHWKIIDEFVVFKLKANLRELLALTVTPTERDLIPVERNASTQRQRGGVSEPAQDGPQWCVYFHTSHFLLLEPETCVLLSQRFNHLSYSTWLLIKLASSQWYTTDGFNRALIPLVDSGNSAENVDKKTDRRKISLKEKIAESKRREGEIYWRLDCLISHSVGIFK